MQLHALLAQTGWPEVRASLLRAYPACAPMIDALADAFAELGTLTPVPGTMRIVLEPSRLPDEAGTMACVVFGRDGSFFPGQDDVPATERVLARHDLSFTGWQEWLGMTVDADGLQAHGAAAVLAHCLREMTFNGFSAQRVETRRQEIAANRRDDA